MGRLLYPAAGIALVSILSCSNVPVCPATCERATLTSRLVAGQLTFATGSEPPETRTLSYNEFASAAPDSCSVTYLKAEIFRDEFVNGVGPAASCEFGSGYLYVNLHAVGDPRALSAGFHTLAPLRENGFVEVLRPGCLSKGGDGVFTVDVGNATGGVAPYPRLVTGDYARDFTMHVEAVADAMFLGTDCPPTSIVLDLSLTQATSDAVFEPMAQCPCE